jgi:tetratricopeptide (TPR) repeat protein
MGKYFLIASAILFLSSCTNSGDARKKVDLMSDDSEKKISDWNTTANTLYFQDKYSDAIKYFDSLINHDSIRGDYYYKRGFSFSKLAEREKAITDFQKAIKYNFKVASSYYNLAINYSFDNDSLSFHYLQKCIEVDPGYTAAYAEMKECQNRLKKRIK